MRLPGQNLALIPARLAVRAALAAGLVPFRLAQAVNQAASSGADPLRSPAPAKVDREEDMQLEDGIVNARRFYVGEALTDPDVPPLLFTFDAVAEAHMDHLCPAALKPMIGHCEERIRFEASSEV